MGNDIDQTTADRMTGSKEAHHAKHQARVEELKRKGYPLWWAESQALSELRIEAECVAVDGRTAQEWTRFVGRSEDRLETAYPGQQEVNGK
jgi:hypothetical protein